MTAFPMRWSGLTFVAELNGTHIYRNQHVLPRAWIIHSPIDADRDWAEQLAVLADQSVQVVATGKYLARITHYEPDRIEVEAQSPENGVLVLSEIWYPGWRATVDGEERPVQQIAGVLRGISLTEGTHRVVLVYDPASVRWGVRASLIGLVSIIGWVGLEVWRRKRSNLTQRG